MIHQSERPRHEMTSGEAGVVGAVLGFGLLALAARGGTNFGKWSAEIEADVE